MLQAFFILNLIIMANSLKKKKTHTNLKILEYFYVKS